VNESIEKALIGFLPAVLPEAILGVVACVLFLGGTFRAGRGRWGAVALLGLALAGTVLGVNALRGPAPEEVRGRIQEHKAALAEARGNAAKLQGKRDEQKKHVAEQEKEVAKRMVLLRPDPISMAALAVTQQGLAKARQGLAQTEADLAAAEARAREAGGALMAEIDHLRYASWGPATVEARREALEELEKSLRELQKSAAPPPGEEKAKASPALAAQAADWQNAVDKQKGQLRATVYASPVLPSRLGLLIKLLALAGGAVLVLFSWDEVPPEQAADYHGCLLLLTAGACLVGSANDLVTLFLALELVSIPTYVLLYLPRTDAPAQEAAMKYFLLSIFSSALLLFGFSYLYGIAGTVNLPALAESLGAGRADLENLARQVREGRVAEAAKAGAPLDRVASEAAVAEAVRQAGPWQGVALVALVMVVAALGFRITAVPFHFYAPDVYQGTTTGMAALLAFLPKLAGFAALVRLLGLVPPALPDSVASPLMGEKALYLLWIMAAVTMSLGNLLALLQDNLKRLLAYSSVAHAGYMLIGLAVAPRLGGGPGTTVGGVEALLFYLVAYGAMTVGAFAVLHYLSTPQRPVETVDDLAGVGRSHPGTALLMCLFLLSLIGIPLTAGFAGKMLLFFDALGLSGVDPAADPQRLQQQADERLLFQALAAIAALNAAVGAWYYLRIAGAMYLREGLQPLPRARPRPVLSAVWVCALLTLALGVYPTPLLKAVRHAVGRPAEPPREAVARAVP
jgi:NADH-quinone oxidoreductase subunit N